MRPVADHETLGASLLSVAVFAGTLAWMLGWFAVDATTPDRSILGRTLPAPVTDFTPPPQVRVSILTPFDSG